MLKPDRIRSATTVERRGGGFAWGVKQVKLVFFNLSVLCLAVEFTSAAPYYVAVSGSDSNPGTISQPFATLEKARDTLRSTGPGTVYVRGGTYYRTSTFNLSSQDSGTTWVNYTNEKPVLSGGAPLGNFNPWKTNILVTDVSTQGISGIHFRQLYCNGALQRLARYPNYAGVGTNSYSFVVSGGGYSRFTFRAGDLHSYANPTEVQVFIFPGMNYGNDIIPISSIDTTNNFVFLNGSTEWAITAGNRYFVQNALEELDAPGEWYLDSASKYLYFYPSNTVTSTTPIYAPVVSSLVAIGSGAANITFQGFTLQYCSGTAVTLTQTTNCLITANTLQNVGDYGGSGVSVTGGFTNGVTSNVIGSVGNHGVRLSGGTTLTRIPANNYADNNLIRDIGCVNKASAGVFVLGVGNRASHNLIFNSSRWGVTAGYGSDFRIEFNHVYGCMLETDDGAAIYIWSNLNWTDCRGSRVAGNFVHDCASYGYRSGGYVSSGYCEGIYIDDFANGVDIVSNIVCRMSYAGIYLHAGRDNRVMNNIVANCGPSQILYSGDDTNSAVWTSYYSSMLSGYNAATNQAAWATTPGMDISPATQWPSGFTMGGNLFATNIVYYSNPNGTTSLGMYNYLTLSSNRWDYNIVYAGGGAVSGSVYPGGSYTWPSWQAQGCDPNSIVITNLSNQPLFSNVSTDDFRLAANSPALAFGFGQITTNSIGPINNPLLVSRPPPPQNLRILAVSTQ